MSSPSEDALFQLLVGFSVIMAEVLFSILIAGMHVTVAGQEALRPIEYFVAAIGLTIVSWLVGWTVLQHEDALYGSAH